MTRRFSVLCLALGTLTLPAAAQETQSQTYRCERGAQMQVTYLNPGERSFAVISFEGRQMAFEIAQSASGVRYVSADGAFVWWTKGDGGLLLHGEGDQEVMIYADCAVVPG